MPPKKPLIFAGNASMYPAAMKKLKKDQEEFALAFYAFQLVLLGVNKSYKFRLN
ncbi:MAG: hypothetical protein ACTS7E_00615 [Arsenophonus sp. NC-CH8-MAG3]